MSLVAVYLASPRAAGHLEWSRLDCLCSSLALLRKHFPPVPVIVFHEDYAAAEIGRLSDANGSRGGLVVRSVDFAGHEADYVDTRPGERVGTYGYRMMCRFWSGWVQRHPLLAGFSHYMRLDDDSYLVAPVPPSAVDRMQSHDYTYSSTFSDPHEGLWRFAGKFMFNAGYLIGPYREDVPYTNFHAASLALWRHPVVSRFVDALEAANGGLRHGWDDAMVAGIIAYALAPALGLSVNLEPEFPYRHNQQCCHPSTGHTPYCDDGSGRACKWGPPAVAV